MNKDKKMYPEDKSKDRPQAMLLDTRQDSCGWAIKLLLFSFVTPRLNQILGHFPEALPFNVSRQKNKIHHVIKVLWVDKMEVAWSNISHVHLRKAWLPALWLTSHRNNICVWTGRYRLPFSPLTRGFTKLQSLVYINIVSIMYVQAEKGVMNAEPAKSWLCHSWKIHHRPSAVSSICLLSNEVAWALMT